MSNFSKQLNAEIIELIRKKVLLLQQNETQLRSGLEFLSNVKLPTVELNEEIPLDHFRKLLQIVIETERLTTEMNLVETNFKLMKAASCIESEIKLNDKLGQNLHSLQQILQEIKQVPLNNSQLMLSIDTFYKDLKVRIYQTLTEEVQNILSTLDWISSVSSVSDKTISVDFLYALEFVSFYFRDNNEDAVNLLFEPLNLRFCFLFNEAEENVFLVVKMILNDFLNIYSHCLLPLAGFIASDVKETFSTSLVSLYTSTVVEKLSAILSLIIKLAEWEYFVEVVRCILNFDEQFNDFSIGSLVFAKVNCVNLWIDKEMEILFRNSTEWSYFDSNCRELFDKVRKMKFLDDSIFTFFLEILHQQFDFCISSELLNLEDSFILIDIAIRHLIELQYNGISRINTEELSEFLAKHSLIFLSDQLLRTHLVIFKNSYFLNENCESFFESVQNLLQFVSLDSEKSTQEKRRIFLLVANRIDEFLFDQIILQSHWSSSSTKGLLLNVIEFIKSVIKRFPEMQVSLPLTNNLIKIFELVLENPSIKQLSKNDFFIMLRNDFNFSVSFLTDENYKRIKNCF